MRKEAIFLPASTCIVSPYTCETADTVQEVAAMMQHAVQTMKEARSGLGYSATQMASNEGIAADNRSEQAALVTIALHFGPEEEVSAGLYTQRQQSTRYFLENLRPLVRKTDVVVRRGYTFYFVLRGANIQGARIVYERLWKALLWRIHDNADSEILRPHSLSSGYSAYPEPCSSIGQCIEDASHACVSFALALEKSSCEEDREDTQLDEDEMFPLLARKLGVPYLALLPRKLPAGVRRLVSPRLAQELCCYPVGRERDMLTVAMSNPQDRVALERLERETGLHIFPVLTHPRELEVVLKKPV